MTRKIFSVLTVFLAILAMAFSGCAHIVRDAQVDVTTNNLTLNVIPDRTVEVVVSSKVEEFSPEEQQLLWCLTVEALQRKGWNPIVSKEQAEDCNILIKNKEDINFFLRKLDLPTYDCQPFSSQTTSLIVLEIDVYEVKKGSQVGNFLIGSLSGRPQINFTTSISAERKLLKKAEIVAKAPQSSRGDGFSVFLLVLQSNSYRQALVEASQQIVDLFPQTD